MKSEIWCAASRGRSIAATLAALSASTALMMMPTKASAFDIGGAIGTAMAIKAQIDAYRGGGYAGGGYRIRSRGVSHHDSDSDDHGSKSGGGERDARDAETIDNASRPDNRLATHHEVLGPSSTSGGLAQASERDAAADEATLSRRTTENSQAFKPSR
jgi:hypothetical protein